MVELSLGTRRCTYFGYFAVARQGNLVVGIVRLPLAGGKRVVSVTWVDAVHVHKLSMLLLIYDLMNLTRLCCLIGEHILQQEDEASYPASSPKSDARIGR